MEKAKTFAEALLENYLIINYDNKKKELPG